jgi:hypothetical protein
MLLHWPYAIALPPQGGAIACEESIREVRPFPPCGGRGLAARFRSDANSTCDSPAPQGGKGFAERFYRRRQAFRSACHCARPMR